MRGLSSQFNDAHQAVSEVDVLATVTLQWFDGEDWSGADPILVGRAAVLLGAIARSATAAVAKMSVFEAAIADAQPAPAGDQWDLSGDTPPAPP